jgi:hypothetical protein
MLRLELLNVKADLERELEDFVLSCSRCGLDVRGSRGRVDNVRPLGAPGNQRRTASPASVVGVWPGLALMSERG